MDGVYGVVEFHRYVIDCYFSVFFDVISSVCVVIGPVRCFF